MSQTTHTPTRDEDILDLYFARDERAISETDRRYGKVCMNVSMQVLGSRSDTEECVADTYIKAWNTIPPTRPQSLCAYISRIVRNLSINRLRDMTAARRSRDMTVSFEELEGCLSVREDASEELSRLLSDFLRAQNETDRRLFIGRYWYAVPVKTLASEYGMTPNAVTLNLRRTRERLRSHLAEGGYII